MNDIPKIVTKPYRSAAERRARLNPLGVAAFSAGISSLCAVPFNPASSVYLAGSAVVLGLMGVGMSLARHGAGSLLSVLGLLFAGVTLIVRFSPQAEPLLQQVAQLAPQQQIQIPPILPAPVAPAPAIPAPAVPIATPPVPEVTLPKVYETDFKTPVDYEGLEITPAEASITYWNFRHTNEGDDTYRFRSKSPCLAIVLNMRNTSLERKVDTPAFFAEAKDNLGNIYKETQEHWSLVPFKKTAVPRKSLYPGDGCVDVILLERPIQTATSVAVELRAGVAPKLVIHIPLANGDPIQADPDNRN